MGNTNNKVLKEVSGLREEIKKFNQFVGVAVGLYQKYIEKGYPEYLRLLTQHNEVCTGQKVGNRQPAPIGTKAFWASPTSALPKPKPEAKPKPDPTSFEWVNLLKNILALKREFKRWKGFLGHKNYRDSFYADIDSALWWLAEHKSGRKNDDATSLIRHATLTLTKMKSLSIKRHGTEKKALRP